MDTKWKRSKKIRAFLIRVVNCGLLFALLFAVATGYPAIKVYMEKGNLILQGDIYALDEFQQYIGDVYNSGMLAFAGVGDDRGYPLQEDSSEPVKNNAIVSFFDEMAKNNGDLIFYMYDSGYEEVEGEYGNAVHTNTQLPLISEIDGYLNLTEDMRFIIYHNGIENKVTSHGYFNTQYLKHSYMPNVEKIGEIQFVMAMKKQMSGEGPLQGFWEEAHRYQNDLYQIAILGILWLISCVFCLMTFKPAREAKRDFANITNKILFECKLVVFLCCLIKIISYIERPLSSIGVKDMLYIFGIGMILYPLFVDFKNDNEAVFTCSIPAYIYNEFVDWKEKQEWQKSLSLLLWVGGIASVICFLAAGLQILRIEKINEIQGLEIVLVAVLVGLMFLAAVFFVIHKFLKEASGITDKISGLYKGDLDTVLIPSKNIFLRETAEELNQLENGIENAVKLKSRSDKMRVELITNVSHDLKTPLTSIINYADLLCEEELPENAKEYANSLREKSYKLKAMVQDVFELSKATSGNLTVEKQTLDLSKLIRQTLADMDERIQDSNLTFKTVFPEENVYIEGDGEKLYRTFQNLYINALQYSLDNSRVYTVVKVEDGMAVVCIKNTSKWELNIDTEEIVERFVRADESRTTEGSGLGLSISKSFVEACGGEFKVLTDADMFTVEIRFEQVEKVEG